MSKKVWIAVAAVVVALVVINFTGLRSHLRLWKKQAGGWVQKQIPPEQEIARLRMELDNLARDDDRHFHQVAVQRVEVKKYEAQVEKASQELADREIRIRAMKSALVGEDKFVTYANKQVSRDDLLNELRTSARSFQTDEKTVEAMKKGLAARKQSLKLNEDKLAELKLVRQQMKTELEQLQTALELERQAQASESKTIDDATYLKTRKELDSVRDRIEIMKEKRTLKGEVNTPIKAFEERKKLQDEIDAYVKDRFGDNKQ
jgi:chromosome segregation ATPase